MGQNGLLSVPLTVRLLVLLPALLLALRRAQAQDAAARVTDVEGPLPTHNMHPGVRWSRVVTTLTCVPGSNTHKKNQLPPKSPWQSSGRVLVLSIEI